MNLIGNKYTFKKDTEHYFVLLELKAYDNYIGLKSKNIYEFKMLNNVPELGYFKDDILKFEMYQLSYLIEHCYRDAIINAREFFYSYNFD